MQQFIKILKKLLYPISLVYGGVVYLRNKLYDWGVFSSQSFNIPVICVAILSRGYGRKTKGFRFVNTDDTAENVGDEPLQMKQKFPQITFAVDEQRARGIAKLQKEGYELVVLDDAFQHRSVRPSKSVVLMDHNRLPHRDCYLPTGNLRDGRYALKRADIVLVTKCKSQLTKEEQQQIIAQNKIENPCFFTSFEYDTITSFSGENTVMDLQGVNVLLVTGIANPNPLQEYLNERGANVTHLSYADHYNFTAKDIQIMAEKLDASNAILLTTEKDKVKLKPLLADMPKLFAQSYYVPIRVAFQDGKADEFLGLLGL